jgi:hypothetical protein
VACVDGAGALPASVVAEARSAFDAHTRALQQDVEKQKEEHRRLDDAMGKLVDQVPLGAALRHNSACAVPVPDPVGMAVCARAKRVFCRPALPVGAALHVLRLPPFCTAAGAHAPCVSGAGDWRADVIVRKHPRQGRPDAAQ